MTATAVSLTMVSLKAEKLQHSAAATGIMRSAILDDIAALGAVAVLVPLATGNAEVTGLGILYIIAKATAFFFLITTLNLIVFPFQSSLRLFQRYSFLGKFGITQFIGFSKGEQATLAVLLVALTISLVSYEFGFHPAVGAYMAGLIIKQEYFHLFNKPEIDYYNQSKIIVDDVAFSWIGSVFFVELGSKIIFDQNIFLSVIPQILSLIIGLLLAQTISASLAARFTGNYE